MGQAAQQLAPVAPAVVFTPRAEIKDVLRQELKALGVTEVHLPEAVDKCVELLVRSREAVLVLDWEHGSETVNQILEATRGHFKIETRPILLLIPDIDDGIVATGAEYGVSQIHAGVPSRQDLKDSLDALLKEDRDTRDIRETLVMVATARDKGDWATATTLLQKLNERAPGQERVLVELGENLIHEGKWDEALALLAPLADLDPPNVRALSLMGRCNLHQGDVDRAIGLLGRAKVLNPHNVERLIVLGHACLKADLVDEAKENFASALALDEDNHEAQVGLSQAKLVAGELNEGLELLKAVSGPRELASVFNTAAILSVRQGRFELGFRLYKTALAAIGRDEVLAVRLLFNMGLGYKRWGRQERAVLCFERCLELDPTFSKAARQKHAANLSRSESDSGAFSEEEFTKGHGLPVAPSPAPSSTTPPTMDPADPLQGLGFETDVDD